MPSVVFTGVLAVGLVCVAAAAAGAAPTMTVTDSCAYSGGQFAVAGNGFAPNERVTLELMATADPFVGAPLQERVTTTSALGGVLGIFDVPVTPGSRVVLRSVRARRFGGAGGGAPPLLATAPLRSVSRVVEVSARESRADSLRHWRLTGLPEGTRLYAHYRRGGRSVARRFVGAAADPCGRVSFDLRTLPRGFGRAGVWELWLTANRVFRRPLKGVYVHRRLDADGSGPRSRVRVRSTTSRLAPLDVRLTTPVTSGMAADASQIGLINLTMVDVDSSVEFFERIDDRLSFLGTASAAPGDVRLATLKDATRWSCDRRDRRFVATATRPGGELAVATHGVRTPSCANRFELSSPRGVAIGRLAHVHIADRWGLGAITPSLCVTAPAARRRCRRIALGPSITAARRRFRATARGSWQVQLRVRDRPVARTVIAVGRRADAKATPTLLATGDSTMQGLDASLGDEFGDRVSVIRDVQLGRAISRAPATGPPEPGDPLAFEPARQAREQSARLRQRTTVVSLGAAEGYDMTTVDGSRVACCDAGWVAEYARRVRVLMGIYARGGRARVRWLTIPLPRPERRIAAVRAVNAAILAASRGLPTVKVVRLDSVFTPDGYRDVMRYRGHDVEVRDVDGIHLSVAGNAIAAQIVAQTLRAA